MSVQVTTLPSGLTIVTDATKHVKTAAIGVLVAVGSRHEACESTGFPICSSIWRSKAPVGAARARSPRRSRTQAATSTPRPASNSTAYFAHILGGDAPLALEILGDILTDSQFDAGELEREKDVIVQEIGAVEDTPDDLDIRSPHLERMAGPGDRAADPGHARAGRRLRPDRDRRLSAQTLPRPGDGGRRGRRGRARRHRLARGGPLEGLRASMPRFRRVPHIEAARRAARSASSRPTLSSDSKAARSGAADLKPRMSSLRRLAAACPRASSRRCARSGGSPILSIHFTGTIPTPGSSAFTRARGRRRRRCRGGLD